MNTQFELVGIHPGLFRNAELYQPILDQPSDVGIIGGDVKRGGRGMHPKENPHTAGLVKGVTQSDADDDSGRSQSID